MTDLIPYQSPPPKRNGTGKPALDINRLVRIANKKDNALDVVYQRTSSEPLDAVQLTAAGVAGGVTGLVACFVAGVIGMTLGGTLATAGAFGALLGLFVGMLVATTVVSFELHSNASSELVTVASVSSEAMLQAVSSGEAVSEVAEVASGASRAWHTLELDFNDRPHVLIAGETGAGKSVTLNAVCVRFLQAYPEARFIICELGGAEWRGAIKTPEAIAETLKATHELVVNRLETYTGRVTHERVVVILEELEAVLDDLKLTDRQAYKDALLAARNIARLGRKAGVHLIVATQSGKADSIDTSIRNNLRLRFLLRSVATVSRSLDCSEDLTQLETGNAWCNEVNAVVSVPFTNQPTLPLYGALGGMVTNTTHTIDTDAPEASGELSTAFFSRVDTSKDTKDTDTAKMPDMDVLTALATLEPVPERDKLLTMIRMVRSGDSANSIYAEVGGNRGQVLAQVKQLKAVLS